MRTVLTILLIAVIGGICALEAVFIRQGRRMPKRSCVRLSVAYPIVGVVFGAMFLYLMNMAVHEQDSNPWVAMGFLVFVLMGVSLILAWINYRIWYDSSGFIIRNVLGVRRDYTYSDITGLREYPKEARPLFRQTPYYAGHDGMRRRKCFWSGSSCTTPPSTTGRAFPTSRRASTRSAATSSIPRAG